MQTIKAVAVYKTKNALTNHSYDGTYWSYWYPCGISDVTEQERYIIGTRCGTIPYNEFRVQDYMAYKLGKKSFDEIVIETFRIPKEMLSTYPMQCHYYNLKLQDWFGDDLINVY